MPLTLLLLYFSWQSNNVSIAIDLNMLFSTYLSMWLLAYDVLLSPGCIINFSTAHMSPS
jgi:hypothetical protein